MLVFMKTDTCNNRAVSRAAKSPLSFLSTIESPPEHRSYPQDKPCHRSFFFLSFFSSLPSALSHPPVTSLARRRGWLEGRRRPNSRGGSGASHPLDLAGSGSPAGGETGAAAAGGGWREGGSQTAEAAAPPPLRQIWPGAVARHEGRWGQL